MGHIGIVMRGQRIVAEMPAHPGRERRPQAMAQPAGLARQQHRVMGGFAQPQNLGTRLQGLTKRAVRLGQRRGFRSVSVMRRLSGLQGFAASSIAKLERMRRLQKRGQLGLVGRRIEAAGRQPLRLVIGLPIALAGVADQRDQRSGLARADASPRPTGTAPGNWCRSSRRPAGAADATARSSPRSMRHPGSSSCGRPRPERRRARSAGGRRLRSARAARRHASGPACRSNRRRPNARHRRRRAASGYWR